MRAQLLPLLAKGADHLCRRERAVSAAERLNIVGTCMLRGSVVTDDVREIFETPKFLVAPPSRDHPRAAEASERADRTNAARKILIIVVLAAGIGEVNVVGHVRAHL